MAFPKKIFVKQDQDGDDVFLIADEDVLALAKNEVSDIKVAAYSLVRTGTVRTTTKFIGDDE